MAGGAGRAGLRGSCSPPAPMHAQHRGWRGGRPSFSPQHLKGGCIVSLCTRAMARVTPLRISQRQSRRCGGVINAEHGLESPTGNSALCQERCCRHPGVCCFDVRTPTQHGNLFTALCSPAAWCLLPWGQLRSPKGIRLFFTSILIVNIWLPAEAASTIEFAEGFSSASLHALHLVHAHL